MESAIGTLNWPGKWKTSPRGRVSFPIKETVAKEKRTVEQETGKGLSVHDACLKLGITEQMYYRWKKEYSGLRVDQAKRLKALEQENLRLKQIVANQALDLSILKEVDSGNF